MDLTTMTSEELTELEQSIQAERFRRAASDVLPLTINNLVEEYQQAAGLTEGSPFVQPTGAHDAIPPNALRSFPDGTTRKNISGQWLAHGPDEFPQGWEIVSPLPDPDNPPAWDPTATYSKPPGATVTHKGVVYDLTHSVALPGWEPGDPAMHAVWKARVV